MAEAKGQELEAEAMISAVEIVAMPWVFTQNRPLDTETFIERAKKRGVDLDLLALRQLYKRGLLAPVIAVTDKPYSAPQLVEMVEPARANGRLAELRAARLEGKVLDIGVEPFMPRLRFETPTPHRSHWWNGLLYSQHQLTILPALRYVLPRIKYSLREGRKVAHLAPAGKYELCNAAQYRRIALMATALEARYLPVLDAERIHLINAELDQYEEYQKKFDPRIVSEKLNYSADQARKDAERLLFAAYRADPTGGPWSQLIRRSPRRAWEHLKDASLLAMDLRETAEILLCFYEDLARLGCADPLPDIPPRMGWHPIAERLSARNESLDENLMSLGISPHSRVVIAVEGESEEMHAPKVWKALGYPNAPELIRYMKFGGVGHDPTKVGALAAAPLIARKDEGGRFWWVIKPPTKFLIAADPEEIYAPDKVVDTRKKILNEIRDVIKAQGAEASEEQIDSLVEIQTWPASCYEFAHFTDEELADAIATFHTTCNGWSREQLIGALAYWRRLNKDIKRAWESGRWDEHLHKPVEPWVYKVSKTKLAEALWPVLERKIAHSMTDDSIPLPPIAVVIRGAYHTAQNWRHGTFVLAVPEEEAGN